MEYINSHFLHLSQFADISRAVISQKAEVKFVSTDKCIYYALCEIWNKKLYNRDEKKLLHGFFEFSNDDLQFLTFCNRKTIDKALSVLQTLGFIAVVGKPNQYQSRKVKITSIDEIKKTNGFLKGQLDEDDESKLAQDEINKLLAQRNETEAPRQPQKEEENKASSVIIEQDGKSYLNIPLAVQDSFEQIVIPFYNALGAASQRLYEQYLGLIKEKSQPDETKFKVWRRIASPSDLSEAQMISLKQHIQIAIERGLFPRMIQFNARADLVQAMEDYGKKFEAAVKNQCFLSENMKENKIPYHQKMCKILDFCNVAGVGSRGVISFNTFFGKAPKKKK